MPASLPGESNIVQYRDGSSLTNVNGTGNPSLGPFIIMDPLSGPKGSPFDEDSTGNASTGGLSTGIGIGGSVIGPTAPESIFAKGYNDNDIPGEVPTYSAAPPNGVVASSAINSTRMYIGGGRSVTSGAPNYSNTPGVAGTNPYTAGVAICGAGKSGSRDGGAGPAFTGFPMKMVTASGAVAIGAAIETGFTNRSGVAMVSGQSAFGSSGTQLAAAS